MAVENDMEYESRVILYDDEGEEVPFEHIDTFELGDGIYIVLLEIIDGVEADEVTILKVVTDDKGDELFAWIDDEDELNAAFEEFILRQEESVLDDEN